MFLNTVWRKPFKPLLHFYDIKSLEKQIEVFNVAPIELPEAECIKNTSIRINVLDNFILTQF